MISPKYSTAYWVIQNDYSNIIFQIKGGIMNIIKVYAPTTEHSDQKSDELYDLLQIH